MTARRRRFSLVIAIVLMAVGAAVLVARPWLRTEFPFVDENPSVLWLGWVLVTGGVSLFVAARTRPVTTADDAG